MNKTSHQRFLNESKQSINSFSHNSHIHSNSLTPQHHQKNKTVSFTASGDNQNQIQNSSQIGSIKQMLKSHNDFMNSEFHNLNNHNHSQSFQQSTDQQHLDSSSRNSSLSNSNYSNMSNISNPNHSTIQKFKINRLKPLRHNSLRIHDSALLFPNSQFIKQKMQSCQQLAHGDNDIEQIFDPCKNSVIQQNQKDQNDVQNICDDKQKQKLNFYKQYKNIDRIINENQFKGQQNEVQLLMLNSLVKHNLLPKKMAMITNDNALASASPNQKQQGINIQINDSKLSMRYIAALNDGIKDCKALNRVEVANNHITPKLAHGFFSNFQQTPKLINFSQNNLGILGCQSLVTMLKQRDCILREINLEENSLSDISAKLLFDGLHHNLALRKLNLSKNKLTDACTPALQKLLSNNDTLEEIYLHWNNLTAIGGALISQGLRKNYFVKVLDLSWNCLGGGQNAQKIKTICDMVADKKRSLIHFDLSHNNFTFDECRMFQQALQHNQSLIGFHFSGHYGVIDGQGFMQLNQHQSIVRNDQCFNQYVRINGIQPHKIQKKKKTETEQELDQQFAECRYEDNKFINSCWICEGWQEVTFKIQSPLVETNIVQNEVKQEKSANRQLGCYNNRRLSKKLTAKQEQELKKEAEMIKLKKEKAEEVLIHFDFENFRGVPMFKAQSPLNTLQNERIFKKVCPPACVKYFFSIKNGPFISKDQPIIKMINKNIPHVKMGDKFYDIEMEELNFVEVTIKSSLVDEYYQSNIEGIMPRQLNPLSAEEKQAQLLEEEERRQKELEKMIGKHVLFQYIKKYQLHVSELIVSCLEFDWKCSKLEKITARYDRQQVQEFQILLLDYYPAILDIFRYLASVTLPVDNVFLCTFGTFCEFMSLCGLVDGVTLSMSDVDLKFRSTKSKATENARFPELNANRSLTRYQFLETLVRVIETKLVKINVNINKSDSANKNDTNINNNNKMSLSKALQYTFNTHILPAFHKYNCDTKQWRELKLQSDDTVHRVFRKFEKPLQRIYDKYRSQMVKKFYSQKLMWFNEFKQVFIDAQLISPDCFMERDASTTCSLSIGVQVDEVNCDRHLQMRFVEFLEGLCRAAEKLSLPPYIEQRDCGEDAKRIQEMQERWPLNRRAQLSLAVKLEALCFRLTLSLLDTAHEFAYFKLSQHGRRSFFDMDEIIQELEERSMLTQKAQQEQNADDEGSQNYIDNGCLNNASTSLISCNEIKSMRLKQKLNRSISIQVMVNQLQHQAKKVTSEKLKVISENQATLNNNSLAHEKQVLLNYSNNITRMEKNTVIKSKKRNTSLIQQSQLQSTISGKPSQQNYSLIQTGNINQKETTHKSQRGNENYDIQDKFAKVIYQSAVFDKNKNLLVQKELLVEQGAQVLGSIQKGINLQ